MQLKAIDLKLPCPPSHGWLDSCIPEKLHHVRATLQINPKVTDLIHDSAKKTDFQMHRVCFPNSASHCANTDTPFRHLVASQSIRPGGLPTWILVGGIPTPLKNDGVRQLG